jgi:hypothetical protein
MSNQKIIMFLLLIIIAGGGYYFYTQQQKTVTTPAPATDAKKIDTSLNPSVIGVWEVYQYSSKADNNYRLEFRGDGTIIPSAEFPARNMTWTRSTWSGILKNSGGNFSAPLEYTDKQIVLYSNSTTPYLLLKPYVAPTDPPKSTQPPEDASLNPWMVGEWNVYNYDTNADNNYTLTFKTNGELIPSKPEQLPMTNLKWTSEKWSGEINGKTVSLMLTYTSGEITLYDMTNRPNLKLKRVNTAVITPESPTIGPFLPQKKNTDDRKVSGTKIILMAGKRTIFTISQIDVFTDPYSLPLSYYSQPTILTANNNDMDQSHSSFAYQSGYVATKNTVDNTYIAISLSTLSDTSIYKIVVHNRFDDAPQHICGTKLTITNKNGITVYEATAISCPQLRKKSDGSGGLYLDTITNKPSYDIGPNGIKMGTSFFEDSEANDFDLYNGYGIGQHVYFPGLGIDFGDEPLNIFKGLWRSLDSKKLQINKDGTISKIDSNGITSANGLYYYRQKGLIAYTTFFSNGNPPQNTADKDKINYVDYISWSNTRQIVYYHRSGPDDRGSWTEVYSLSSDDQLSLNDVFKGSWLSTELDVPKGVILNDTVYNSSSITTTGVSYSLSRFLNTKNGTISYYQNYMARSDPVNVMDVTENGKSTIWLKNPFAKRWKGQTSQKTITFNIDGTITGSGDDMVVDESYNMRYWIEGPNSVSTTIANSPKSVAIVKPTRDDGTINTPAITLNDYNTTGHIVGINGTIFNLIYNSTKDVIYMYDNSNDFTQMFMTLIEIFEPK